MISVEMDYVTTFIVIPYLITFKTDYIFRECRKIWYLKGGAAYELKIIS